MKQALFLASGFAWLNLASAACCRSNKCLKAIVQNENGIEDCAAVLIETVSVPASVVTETVIVSATQYATVLGTVIVTETESTTAATETILFTQSSVVTVGTETVSLVTTETTIASTETVFETITLPPAPTEKKKRDIDTLTFVEPTSSASVELAPVQSSPALPEYALDCPSFDKYKSACKCVGGEVTTITVPASASTVTVEETTTIFASVAATVTTTETELVSVTATTSATATVIVEDVETVTATQTDVVSLTTTVIAIETATLAPEPVQPVCQINTDAFRATSKINGNDYYIYANLLNALTGGTNWQVGSTSNAASIQNRYNIAIDSEGYLYLHDNVPPYSYIYYFYISTINNAPSNWPQVNTKATVEAQIRAGSQISKIKGCVNPATGELTLQDSVGRNNILWCGAQMWLSRGLGEEINRGVCQQVFPKVVAPYRAPA
ncbi:unnamed protein product [Sordaria macrospora k-hell]|uniref:WGS project CABT00000000 data, contig 2.30 n=2 Tax=Sordaria macrospora TaxID=5147 RepID=F7W572_SORMK|nr:uncharacterized protein SMAC_05621 [Sordaria macrospora k-hell]CCC12660.1 unnamed protein product [Sordaria macrospora k-hell]